MHDVIPPLGPVMSGHPESTSGDLDSQDVGHLLVTQPNCKVIEGMKVAGIMKAKLRFHLPGSVSFEECRITPLA